MATKKLDELRTAVRARGLRATPSRLAVLALLRASAQPVSHAEVTARLTDGGWDPATLYRNLIDFTEVGLVRRTDLGDHVWRFEVVHGDHDTTAHPHFVCIECGAIECLLASELVIGRAKAPRAVRQRQVEVRVRGVCDACA